MSQIIQNKSISCSAPLIDLHRHLDGNIRPSSILSLAQKHNIALPTMQLNKLKQHVYIQDRTSDLLAFLQKLNIGISVLANSEACYKIAYENVEDAIVEGLAYVELRFSPMYMASTYNLDLNEVCEAVVAGVRDANSTLKFNAKLIGIISRTYGVDVAWKELNALLQASKSAPEIVAIDLAGDEKNFPAKLFAEHFKKVASFHLPVTIHAGEADGPQSIWDAINILGASRIGHGVAAMHDNLLMDYMYAHKIGIESCLLSNYQTGTWTDIASHPVRLFLEKELQVSLHTDDPGVSNNTLLSEYELAQHTVGLCKQQISTLKWNALAQAFLSDSEKNALKQKYI